MGRLYAPYEKYLERRKRGGLIGIGARAAWCLIVCKECSAGLASRHVSAQTICFLTVHLTGTFTLPGGLGRPV